ncbi:MAG: glycosyltransferase family 2 protein [Hydrogenophilales bacterium]|nr:glycosyltransferase family 2 protein [Hydrogenophilales bacterium]
MPLLSFAFCTYNRADRLEKLVAAMRAQTCPIPFEILAINNNSTDATVDILTRLEQMPGPTLRWVTEPVQGIVTARNRGIAEALHSDILVFIDDDEIPLPGLLQAAADAILNEGAECAGGRVDTDFTTISRPTWLEDDLLGFLAALDHGPQRLWIQDMNTPLWTGNIAYDMRLFRHDSALRFDMRYNREGTGVGGGEDTKMLRTLLERKARIRYRPEMVVRHAVEPWKLRRSYFLKLHYRAGVRHGRFSLPRYPQALFGVPPFMVAQFLAHCGRTLKLAITGKPGLVRQAMNAAHALGSLQGYRNRPGE